MTSKHRGRLAPSPPPPFPGAAAEPPGIYAWNKPRPAINPHNGAEFTPAPSQLANLIALYAADSRREREQREALSDQVWSRFFNTESRDPELRESQQIAALNRAGMAREQQRFNPDLRIIDDLRAQPKFISKPLLARVEHLKKDDRPERLSRYLRSTVVPVLARLDAVRNAQISASFRFMANRDGLGGLLKLPEMGQTEVRQLAVRIAAHMDLCLADACDALPARGVATAVEIWKIWWRVASEASRLDVTPPAFEALRPKKHRRKPIPYDLIPGSLKRLRCAEWWNRKIWSLRNEWREEQLRAACLVSKKTSPYVSHEAVIHKREQRRRSLEFLRAHELVNEDGDVLDMESVVNASASNPAHRRNEMMACVKGLELIAEMRGDSAVFYTITCPARYHATLSNGKPNPGWSSATVRQSSDYLVNMFASFRKALHRAGLRWYGLRVAEPHHDGTVHWHLLCFMRKKERRRITALLRKFAIREDRAELGNDTGPRFKSELINPRKGSPTSYIAKYVSKNIDGRGLSDVVSKETGRCLRDTAEHVTTWASLHRVQQFRFVGIPSRQAYRELRLFAGQAGRQAPGRKPGAPVLADPRLDAVLAAADVGCFATYITKQGGVLVPRAHHLIRTAYERNDEPGIYGDYGIRIYGVWSPLIAGRICTHAVKWKKVRKTISAVDVPEAPAQGGPSAPWTRGNNCPPVEKTTDPAPGRGAAEPQRPPAPDGDKPCSPPDFDNMTRNDRRQLLKRLREPQPKPAPASMPAPATDRRAAELRKLFTRLGIDAEPCEIRALIAGARVRFGPGYTFRFRGGQLIYLN